MYVADHETHRRRNWGLVQLLWTLVYLVTTIYFFILVVRILYSLVNVFVRDWRPRSINLIIAELVMTLTDPPLRFFRRFIPPLRLGQVSLDLSFIVVFLIVMIIRFIALQGATAWLESSNIAQYNRDLVVTATSTTRLVSYGANVN